MDPPTSSTGATSYWQAPDGWQRQADLPPFASQLWIVDQLAREPGPVGRFRLDRRPALHGEAWADAEGRLARVTWSFNPRRRPRGLGSGDAERAWRTLELFDYGLPVDIPIPDSRPPDPWPVLARDLWRMGRDVRRRERDWEAG